MFDSYTHRRARKARGAFLCVLAMLLALPVIGTADEGDTWIVFDCKRPDPEADEYTYWDIWKLDPEGDGQPDQYDGLYGDPLTTDPANEWDPTYSVEDRGGSVVFVSDRDGWPRLYRVSINGGAWTPLTSAGYAAVDPCYSFDGDLLAYTSNETGSWQIHVMNLNTGSVKRITHSADNRSPCFSHNGDKVYFISNRDAGATGDWEIYVVNTSGGTATKAILDGNDQPLLLDYTEHDPCCSPTDPNIIVFATNVSTPAYTDPGIVTEGNRINFELFSYSFDTKDTTRLTESWNEYIGEDENGNPVNVPQLWNSSMPCFSPDGNHIAWSADNWTRQGWQGNLPENRPYSNSFWKPDFDQGSCHQIWTCELDHINNDHYYFPPSFWGWSGSAPEGVGYGDHKGHQHHKHYNPSWDEQP